MKKILIVEDEQMLSSMYADKFKHAGFEVVQALSAEDGLEILQKDDSITIVLLDILLPDKSGVEFLKEIRTMPKFNDLPIMVFSNYDSNETKKECLDLGAKGYYLKTSLIPSELVEVINGFLGDAKKSA
jgi:DNA-binding response OmpR family regulator